ncbi:MAG: hypothetical protein OEV59_03000 [Deltaproteobacteria bacterium]|nr:hypothetical protein [Deltaproteobacteria bacterium]
MCVFKDGKLDVRVKWLGLAVALILVLLDIFVIERHEGGATLDAVPFAYAAMGLIAVGVFAVLAKAVCAVLGRTSDYYEKKGSSFKL